MPSGTNRYAGIAKLTYAAPGQPPRQYYARPILPQLAAAKIARQATVTTADRPDLIANRAFGDPLTFWWIANANGWLDPFAMTAIPGTVVMIPAPSA